MFKKDNYMTLHFKKLCKIKNLLLFLNRILSKHNICNLYRYKKNKETGAVTLFIFYKCNFIFSS